MIDSPISIPLAASQSRKPSDLVKTQALAADALEVECYVNSRMDQEYVREFDFATLAVELSMDRERVNALLSKLAGQENAISVCNPQKRPKTPAPGRANRAGSQSNAGGSIGIESNAIASEATV